MPNVSNLKIGLQKGTDSTYYATWDFKEVIKKTVTTTNSSGIASGDWVTIKSGATYYNGVAIPSWVMSDTWNVIQVTGDRAVLGKNRSGSHNIISPISTKYLSNGKSSSSSTTTTEETTNYLDHYTVKWYYATGDGVWFEGSESDSVKSKQSIYNAPSNAYKIKVSVKPVSKTYKVNDKDVSYWTGTYVSEEFLIEQNPPEKPSTPTVEIDGTKLTAKLENISDPRTDKIYFEVYKGSSKVNTGEVKVVTCRATMSWTISLGSDYRVRCRAINIYGKDTIYSSWSDFSNSVDTKPVAPKSITELKALSETSVSLKWESSGTVKSYTVEYTTKKTYFDANPSEVKSVSVTINRAEITGMETGQEYFFRVCAVNDVGSSTWSPIRSIIIGKKPAAPTTWSSTTTAIVGESLTLYWVHNAEDNSSQTYAQLDMYVDGVRETHTIKNTTDEDEKNKTSSYAINTSLYKEGVKISWKVRTAGITKEYGDWSTERTIDVYAKPTADLNMTDVNGNTITTLNGFPFYISCLTGPATQAPIGYHLSVTSNARYETVDSVGNVKMVNYGDTLYSKYFDIKDKLVVEMPANNIDLENGVEYTVTCVASMDSGLTSETRIKFDVKWDVLEYEPDAEIGVDQESYIAYISPYCITEDGSANTDILLSVYRREFDGTYTSIATGIDTASNTYVIDPHPSLDYARYRIVAKSISTGTISYYDPPGYPVNCSSVIIQWDDEWTNFDASETAELEDKPWIGSMLKLPYNIDISDNNSPDVSLVKYIGRSYPVAYYGTQIGSTATWSMSIPADDKETLYALRRLAIWMGNVYVREPSGSGYWANVKVSFNQKHKELTIPVSLDITRVEGGI